MAVNKVCLRCHKSLATRAITIIIISHLIGRFTGHVMCLYLDAYTYTVPAVATYYYSKRTMAIAKKNLQKLSLRLGLSSESLLSELACARRSTELTWQICNHIP